MEPVLQESGSESRTSVAPSAAGAIDLVCRCGTPAAAVVDCDTSVRRGFVHVLLDCGACGRLGWVEVADEVLVAFDRRHDDQPAAMRTTPTSANATPPS